MKITNLTKPQIFEIVKGFHYRLYSQSSFRASPLVFEQIVIDDTNYALKMRRGRACGFTLLEMIVDQIKFEREHNLCSYNEYFPNI
jgi:hypothetical protein